MKKFCNSLREHATNILNFEKKEMLLLTKKEFKSHQDARTCYICGKRILQKLTKSKNYRKFRDHCHYTGKCGGAAHSFCNLKFNVPNEIPAVLHLNDNLTEGIHKIKVKIVIVFLNMKVSRTIQ